VRCSVVEAEPPPSAQDAHARGSDGLTDLPAALQAARSGEEIGFVTLYRDLQPRLFRYATALVGRDDAEDVTAEAWLQIARDLPRFAGGLDEFRGWATTIVRNRAMDLLRAAGRRPHTPSGLEGWFSEGPAAQDTAAAAMELLSTHAAVRLISALPRTEAEVVLLRVVVGLDTRTVAAVLGKRPGAVRVAAHRGLRRLARCVHYLPQERRWSVE
jgi:RNA polymerase sigma-70 factor (ECF subfamily)